MKKVAIICHENELFGAEQSLIDYLRVFDRLKYSVTVFLPKKRKNNAENAFIHMLDELSISYKIYNLFVRIKPLSSIKLIARIKDCIKIIYNKFFLGRFKKQLKQFDVIISNSFAVMCGAEAAYMLNKPHIFHIREFMELDHCITHYNIGKVKKLCQYSAAVFISNSIKEYYLKKYEFKDYKIVYDRVNFDTTFVKKRKFYENGVLNILMAGALHPNKGQFDAIKAVELLSGKINLQLILCGDGPNGAHLKQYCLDNNLTNIIFLGQVSNSELVDIRKNIDISLICSKMEALGRVTIESMYYESLTIGCNSGETSYLLDNDRGFLYNFGNYSELSKIILYAINNIKEVERRKKKAKDFARNEFNNDVLSLIC